MFHFCTPEYIRKPEIFRRFQGLLKWTISIKWVNVSCWKKGFWVGFDQSYNKVIHHRQPYYHQHHPSSYRCSKNNFQTFSCSPLLLPPNIVEALFLNFLERPLLATNSTLSASLFPEFRLFFRCSKICLSFFLLLMMNLRSQRASILNLKNIADIWYYLMFSSIAIIDELLFKP